MNYTSALGAGRHGTFDVLLPICEGCTLTLARVRVLPGRWTDEPTTLEPCAFCDHEKLCRAITSESCNGHAGGAIPNGHEVVKVNSEPGDDGTRGRVIGSIGVGGMIGYYIAWSPRPRVPVFIASPRVAVAP